MGKVAVSILVVLGICCFAGAMLVPPPAQTMGATGDEVTGVSMSLQSILALLGGGSFTAAIAPFLPKLKSFVSGLVPTGVPADTLEIVQAAIGYATNKDDKQAQSRFIHAALAVIRDILVTKFPAVAAPLNALVVAIANSLYPPDSTVQSGDAK